MNELEKRLSKEFIRILQNYEFLMLEKLLDLFTIKIVK